MRTTILATALTLATITAHALDRELCQTIAANQRSYAELRDSGVSLQKAIAFQQQLNRKYDFPPALAKVLLSMVEATYSTQLSPDAVEVINYTICLEMK